MVDKRKPRKGSMAVRPRKRAKSQNAKVCWLPSEEKRVLGFAGYKAGMTHVSYIDQTESPTKGQEIVSAATVIEVPPLSVYGIRYYGDGVVLHDVLTENGGMLKRVGILKRKEKKEIKIDEVKDVRLLVFAQPERTSIGKKKIERMEIGCGGKDVKEKIELASSLLGKEIRASELFKPGEFVDVIAVTKGKGWQGPVKRFGISVQRRKATGKRRHVGTLGAFHPPYVFFTVPQAGQMGYHKRTELNKMILKVGTNPDEINPKSGFTNYGFVKNDYIIIKGSVGGPVKRLVKIRVAVRNAPLKEPQIISVATANR
ncbi:MAG: 50S ribosomal protein L3 [Candidatus Bilamarchaeaceae archaeon]